MVRARSIVATLVACATLVFSTQSYAISAPALIVRVRLTSTPPEYEERRIRLSDTHTATLELDLGEEIDGQEVRLSGMDPVGEYRLLERFRTSVTIMGEGPHLDLIDWRHYDSAWQTMRRTSSNRFRARVIGESESQRFPKVSRGELERAVYRQAGRGWPEPATLVRQCTGTNTYPCGVGVSSRYFRAQLKVEGNWVTIGTVEVRIPMGC